MGPPAYRDPHTSRKDDRARRMCVGRLEGDAMSSNERFHPQGGSRPSVFLGLMLGLVLAIGMGLLSSAFSQDTATTTQADTSALTVAESADHGQYLTDN